MLFHYYTNVHRQEDLFLGQHIQFCTTYEQPMAFKIKKEKQPILFMERNVFLYWQKYGFPTEPALKWLGIKCCA